MNSYLNLVPAYLKAHRKRARLTIVSVAISVALITGIFSMLDVFLQFEKVQVIHDFGNYHLSLENASAKEIQAISSRIDVETGGRLRDFGAGITIDSYPCGLAALDGDFAGNMNIELLEGSYPLKENEIMLEQWAAQELLSGLEVGDRVEISFPGQNTLSLIISGIYNDLGNMKAKSLPGVFISMDLASKLGGDGDWTYLFKFKNGVKVLEAEKDLKSVLAIPDDRLGRNERLLAVTGQSTKDEVKQLYTLGAILFSIVLASGIVMIYNTFNLSVMERVRQFGLLRCIGASRSQIKALVRREGLLIVVKSIPIGVIAGMVITFACSAILKFYNDDIFAEIALFTISPLGIVAGIAAGVLTVFMASLMPARKAARISPVNAVTGNDNPKFKKGEKRGFLTKLLPVETAMGLNNALLKKKTLILMSASIAFSIIMFLGFQVFIDFMYSSLKTTKPYTPDISLISEQGLSNDLYVKLSEVDGVKRVYGRMFDRVSVTFDASRLTEAYKQQVGPIEIQADGLFIPPEKSWLISYDRDQLKWADLDLIEGTLNEDRLKREGGIIAVATNLRQNVTSRSTALQLGDKVYVETPGGTQTLTIMGILRSLPYGDSELDLATFITTEEQFTALTGKSVLSVIDLQLNAKNQTQTLNIVKGMLDDSITLLDARQQNAEIDQTFLTMAVFVYGFVALIGLISILNIINTMNTSVQGKFKYLGVMRAVGMSGTQVNRMALTEAAAYSFSGCLAGCILGILLQKALIADFLTALPIAWKFPLTQIILIVTIVLTITVLSVISPIKRFKARGIAEVINSL